MHNLFRVRRMRTLSRGSQPVHHADMNYARAIIYDKTRARKRKKIRPSPLRPCSRTPTDPLTPPHPRARIAVRFHGGVECLMRVTISIRDAVGLK